MQVDDPRSTATASTPPPFNLVQELQALLLDLNDLDDKWHVRIPSLVEAWRAGAAAAVAGERESRPSAVSVDGMVTNTTTTETKTLTTTGAPSRGPPSSSLTLSSTTETELLREALRGWAARKTRGRGREGEDDNLIMDAQHDATYGDQTSFNTLTGWREWVANLEINE